ncbi:hypothetical protein ACB092_10G034000 [Castanea dentata]
MTHRKHAEYLNKKIELYDKLAIVVSKDTATGSFSKSYVDIDTKQDNGESTANVADNGEDGVVDKGKNVVESSTSGSTISKSCKRGRAPPFDDKINRGPIDYTSLYLEVMAMAADGYSDEMLATAVDHLCENKKAARGFLTKNAKLRNLWMDGFLLTRL